MNDSIDSVSRGIGCGADVLRTGMGVAGHWPTDRWSQIKEWMSPAWALLLSQIEL